MKTRRIEVKSEQLERLVDDLRALPPKPLGSCFSDEQFVDYALGSLDANEIDTLDRHLAGCTACAKTLEHMLAEREAPQKITTLDFSAAVVSWATFTREPARKAAAGADVRLIWEWQSPDGTAAAHAVREADGDLTFRFSSTDIGLADRSMFIRCGAKRFEARLERVSDTEVGGKIVIPRDQRPEDLAQIALEMS